MRKAILIGALLSGFGCSSYTPPAAQPSVVRETQINSPVEGVWRALIRYFGEHNVPIENMDHSSFFMKTKPVDLGATFSTFEAKALPIRNAWCDCGTASIAGAWTTESRILLSFNIVLESRGAAAATSHINTFFEGVKVGKVNLYSSGNDTSIKLTCVSTGRLEQEIAEYLRAKTVGATQ